MLTVRSNHLQFDRRLARDLGEDLPRVLRRAVNQTAVEIVGKSGVGRRSFSGYAPAEGYFQKWTKRVFDKPVPFTQRAATMAFASTRKPVARLFIKDRAGKGTPAAKYLRPQITGEYRGHTRWEKFLIAKGLMRSNEYAMPGAGIRLNRYGNVPTRVYPEIVAQLRIGTEGIGNATGKTMKRRKTRGIGRVFVPGARDQGMGGNADSLPRGIWQRKADGTIVPLFIFTTNRPAYEKRFRFRQWTAQTVRQRLPVWVRRHADAILRKPNRPYRC